MKIHGHSQTASLFNTRADTANTLSALLHVSPVRLGDRTPPLMPGVYAITYRGTLELYAPLSRLLLTPGAPLAAGGWPLYVGSTTNLRKRSGEHAAGLRGVEELPLCHMEFIAVGVPSLGAARYGEDLAITAFTPVWNADGLAGFGSRPPGKTRTSQRTSAWGVLHRGRAGIATGDPGLSRVELVALVRAHLERTVPEIAGVSGVR